MSITVTGIAFTLLGISLLLAVLRLFRGPTLPDRVVGLELTSILVIGFILVQAVDTSEPLYVDVAVAMALMAFLGTVALARYVERLDKR